MQQAFEDFDSIGAQIEATNRLLDPPVPEKKCRQAWALLTHLFWRFGQFLKAIFGNRTLQN